jgi:2-polyprenyl-6-methoxyphenol hydroxylase-like FAD-dependent oxidoreductase
MARIVIIGAGVVGLGTALLLAKDGHAVTVLERDPAPPPETGDGWYDWDRRGVNQFRQPHGFQAGFRRILDAELPEVPKAIRAAGGLDINIIRDVMPASVTGGWRDGDERYGMITGRRPFVEAVIARIAQSTPGIDVRRGQPVGGLVTGRSDSAGIPNVVGVRTEDGETIRADLVVDMSGRRSPLPHWLGAIGARAPHEEIDDCGFMYFGRHFRSANGAMPVSFGPPLMHWGTISSLAVPADNGTWCLGIITASRDKALYGLRHLDRWEAVVKSLPLVAHWLDGKPLDEGVSVITKLEDRYRSLVVDNVPVATGIVTVGDAWAASNPSVGRGASIGMKHAVVLRDTLRRACLERPTCFVHEFHRRTSDVVEPWYRTTLAADRHRLAEVHAGMCGEEYRTRDEGYRLIQALLAHAALDPECLRAALDIRSVLRLPEEVLRSDPGLAGKLLQFENDPLDRSLAGPDRTTLLQLATS